MSYLVLVRHGSTPYNEKGLWTGRSDPDISEKGKEEAEKIGDKLSDITFDYAFSSPLKRCDQTLRIILNKINQNPSVQEDNSLTERDYGDYTGKNKWEIKEKLGEDEFMKLRRGWDYPIPHGESLKDVYERLIPYFKEHIEPHLRENKNILFVSSGNALRSLIKYVEKIDDVAIARVEIATGEAFVYQTDNDGNVTQKEIRSIGSIVP